MQPLYLTTADFNAIDNNTTVVAEGLTARQLIEKYGDLQLKINDTAAISTQGRRRIVGMPSGVFDKLFEFASTNSILPLEQLLNKFTFVPIGNPGNVINFFVVFRPVFIVLSSFGVKKITKNKLYSIYETGLAASDVTVDVINPVDDSAIVSQFTVTPDVDGDAEIGFTIPTGYTGTRAVVKLSQVSVAKTDVTPNLDRDIVAENEAMFIVQ